MNPSGELRPAPTERILRTWLILSQQGPQLLSQEVSIPNLDILILLVITSQWIYLAPRLYFVLRPTHVDGEDEVRHHVEGHVADNDPGGARLKLSLGKINGKKYGYDTWKSYAS